MKKSLKICLSSLAPFIGGAEVALERLALGLKEKGHMVVCALGSKNEVGERFSRKGIKWIYFPMPFTGKWNLPYYVYSLFRMRIFLKKQKFDIVHANDLPSFQFISCAAKPFGIPRICHHRYIFDSDAIKWFLKFGVEFHIFVSNALYRDMTSAYPSFRSEPSRVIYDGLELCDLPNTDTKLALRKKLNLPPDDVLVLFAGQIIPRKGIKDLIEAWHLIPSRVKSKAELIVIGDDLAGKGTYAKKMKQFADKLGESIDFRGFQKNVDDWLDAVDIIVVPSHIEPLGNATLEAMNHAKPVIGTKVGGIPEMIVNEVTGLLVPPNSPKALSQAMLTLIEDRTLSKKMGENARRHVEKMFNINNHIENIISIYQSILDKK